MGTMEKAVMSDDLERLGRLDAERRARFEAIRAKNADKDPDEVERDIAKEITAMRAKRRTPRARRSAPGPAISTLEAAYGSVQPRSRPEDFKAISRAAKEAHAARALKKKLSKH